jgi:hypothetical protein
MHEIMAKYKLEVTLKHTEWGTSQEGNNSNMGQRCRTWLFNKHVQISKPIDIILTKIGPKTEVTKSAASDTFSAILRPKSFYSLLRQNWQLK